MTLRDGRGVIRQCALVALLAVTSVAVLPPAVDAQTSLPAAVPLTLDTLLARFAALQGLHAHFREEKHLEVLAVPLVSEGTLDYAPPARLVRHTTTPAPATLLVLGDQVGFGDEHGQQPMDVHAAPVVRQVVGGFLALVGGDRRALEQMYDMDFALDPHHRDGWQIALRPRLQSLQRIVRIIRLRGEGVTLAWMSIEEATGDATTTTFSDVDPDRRYTPDEITRLFRLAP